MIDLLRQMAIFAKTVDHGSFRGAAAELRLSPSVVSHHISQLEEHLGVALLYRTTRKLSLTPDGARLLEATRTMLAAVEGEIAALTASARSPSGELRITLPSVLSNSEFVDAIATFQQRYPKVRLTLDFSDERKDLVGHGFDIAIRMALTAKRGPHSRKLFHTERKLVAARAYVQDRPEPQSPEDLAEWDWLELAGVRNKGTVFTKGGQTQTANYPEARMSSSDANALYRLTRTGAGLAIVPEFLIRQDVAEGRVVVVLPDWQLPRIESYAEWPANAPKRGLSRLFVSELSEMTGEI